MTPTPSLYVATPAYGGIVHTSYMASLLGLQGMLLTKNIEFSVGTLDNCSMLAHARNVMVFNFLKTEHSHMLFVDSDMGFNPNDILHMLSFPAHEVSAIMCPKKSHNWEIIRGAVRKSPDIDLNTLAALGADFTGMFSLPPGVNTMRVDGSPIEVHAIGTGIMLISRAMVERIIASGSLPAYTSAANGFPDPVHEFFRIGITDGILTGEDYFFCNLAREHGVKLYGFANFAVTHTGMHTFKGDIPAIIDYYDGPIQAHV